MTKRRVSEDMCLLESYFGHEIVHAEDTSLLSAAFRKWALVNHPDKGGSTKLFQEVCGAYSSFCGRDDEPAVPKFEDIEEWLKDFNTGHGHFGSQKLWRDFVEKCAGMFNFNRDNICKNMWLIIAFLYRNGLHGKEWTRPLFIEHRSRL